MKNEKNEKDTMQQQDQLIDGIITSFENSILDPNLDLTLDMAELTADALELIGFPLFGFFVKAGKAATNVILSVRDQLLLGKTYATAQAFNAKTIEPKKLEKYRKKLEKSDYARAEVGRILDLIDKSTEIRKCQILGNLYKHYVNEEISFKQFYELTEALNRLFTTDEPVLKSAYKNGGVGMDSNESYRLDRLIAIGMLENKNRFGGNMRISDAGDLIQEIDDCKITLLGTQFCRYGLEIKQDI